jgi:hypothetical protein
MARLTYGKKATVESCRSIDVLDWNQQGYFKSPHSFPVIWAKDGTPTASIRVETERHSVTLRYSVSFPGLESSGVVQSVPVVWTACRFGGERPWFLCPGSSNGVPCGRKVTKLYGAGHLFACRHCYRLSYTSQQESMCQRGAWKSHKIRMRLGGQPSVFDDFPDRPKGMHWRTYLRLRDRAKTAESGIPLLAGMSV